MISYWVSMVILTVVVVAGLVLCLLALNGRYR